MVKDEPRPVAVGDALPDISLPNQNGEMIRLRRYVGVVGQRLPCGVRTVVAAAAEGRGWVTLTREQARR